MSERKKSDRPRAIMGFENTRTGAWFICRTERPTRVWSATKRIARLGQDSRLAKAIREDGPEAFAVHVLAEDLDYETSWRVTNRLIARLREMGADLYNEDRKQLKVTYACGLCHEKGHNRRTCQALSVSQSAGKLGF